MRNDGLRAWCAAAAAGVATAAACGQGAEFTPIAPLVPGHNIAALGISDDGSTVVGMTGPGGQQQQAFRWRQATGVTQLWPGYAYDASADGNVVVGGTGLPTNNAGQAVRWDGAVQVLGGREARAVSASGAVVVGGTTAGTSSTMPGSAFRWTVAGGLQLLPAIIPGTGMYAYDVSIDGGVVVGYGNPGGTSFSEAFRWTSSGTQRLGGMPGGGTVDTIATACSASGAVLAGFGDGVQLGEFFRWTAGGYTGLGVIPGMAFSIANDISGDGAVIVGSLFTNDFHAVIWDQAGGLRLLQDDLQSRFGLTLPGWTLHVASAISSDGRKIAGYATSPSGERNAFVVTIPALAACYADCNGDAALNLADFGCFQTKFVMGDSYCDCNGDQQLNLGDFGCFTTKFALGCL